MKARLFSCVLLISVASSGVAAERAVETLNYEIGSSLRYLRVDDGSSSEKSWFGRAALEGQVVIPAGTYVGLSLNAQYDRARQKFGSIFTADTDTLLGAAKIFYRNPSIGKVSIGYERDRATTSTEYNSPSFSFSSSDRIYFRSHVGLIEGYIGPVTIGAQVERHYYPLVGGFADGRSDGTFARADWYVASNIRLGVTAGFEDAADSYQVGVEIQPAFVRDRAGIAVVYLHDHDVNGLLLGVKFYFDKRLDLLTRDRHYR